MTTPTKTPGTRVEGVDYVQGRPAPTPVEDHALEQWAAALAASLPPFTATEAASVGHLAAELDTRHRAKAAAA